MEVDASGNRIQNDWERAQALPEKYGFFSAGIGRDGKRRLIPSSQWNPGVTNPDGSTIKADLVGLQADPLWKQIEGYTRVATPQDLAEIADPNGFGNGEGGSDFSNIMTGLAFIGGGAALTGAFGGAAGSGLGADLAGGAMGATEAGITGLGADLAGGAMGATDAAAAAASSGGGAISNALTSLGISPSTAASVASAVSRGATLDNALRLAGIAAPVIGAVLGSSAIRQAIAAQQQGTDQAIAESRRQFDQGRSDLAPFREAGTGAINRLSDLTGTSGRTDAPNYGDLNKKFTLEDFWSDPVTQASFRQGLDLGTQSLDNSARARGTLNSGAQLKALTRFGTDYTGNQAAGSQQRFVGDQTNQFNRLSAIAGTGQTAATNTAQFGTQNANTVGNLLSAQGNARGAAAIGQGNLFANAGGSIANTISSQNTLDAILNARRP